MSQTLNLHKGNWMNWVEMVNWVDDALVMCDDFSTKRFVSVMNKQLKVTRFKI